MTALYMFLAAVCVLGPLIMLHEWGHYVVARLCGVKVLTYSVGFGPRLFGWRSAKSGIDYRVSLLPLGGYVKMLDERDAPVSDDEKHLAFNNQHPLKKIAIVAAGPLMNFLVAALLFFVLLLQPSEQLNTRIGKIDSPADQSGLAVGDKIVAVDGKAVQTWQDVAYALVDRMGESGEIVLTAQQNQTQRLSEYRVPVADFLQSPDARSDPLTALGALPWQPVIEPIIERVTEGGAAERMGFLAGDKILRINGQATQTWQDVVAVVRQNPETTLEVAIARRGETVELPLMPQGVKQNGQIVGQAGIQVKADTIVIPEAYKMRIDRTPTQAATQAVEQTYRLSVLTLRSIVKMAQGLVGLDNLSGPLTIADVSKQSFSLGLLQVLYTAAVISVSLAVLNLLPIPVLDGGHIVYALYEWVVGKPLSERAQITGVNIGMLLLFGVTVVAISNDITRFFG